MYSFVLNCRGGRIAFFQIFHFQNPFYGFSTGVLLILDYFAQGKNQNWFDYYFMLLRTIKTLVIVIVIYVPPILLQTPPPPFYEKYLNVPLGHCMDFFLMYPPVYSSPYN